MTGFATLQSVKDALATNAVLTQHFNGVGPGSAATPAWQSGWYTQLVPDVGADPAAASGTPGAGGTAYSNAVGGMVFPDVSTEKFIVDFNVRHANASVLGCKLVDRLVGVGSIVITGTGAKNVNSVALPRYTTGEAVECYFEVQTAGTTTAPVVTLSSYTNQDGVGGQVGGSVTFHSATATKGSLQGPLPLAAGDTGIRSVEQINVGTAGGGSAAINVILVKTLMWSGSIPVVSRYPEVSRTSPIPYTTLVRAYDGATLQWMRKGGSSGSSMEGWVKVLVR